ncbi:MAG: hypothetical protein V5A43_00775 [Haloarculaceae archaeon]
MGASWAVGPAVPILLLSLLFLGLGLRVPSDAVHVVGVLVGGVLVALGLRLLAVTFGGVDRAAHRHSSGDSHGHPPDVSEAHSSGDSHAHRFDDGHSHRHLRLGPVRIGRHGHLDVDSALVGVAPGVAGSGALVVAVASTASTLPVALSFLAAFAVLSIPTMAAVSSLWGQTLGTGVARPLQAAAGGAGILVGVVLIAEVALGSGVL